MKTERRLAPVVVGVFLFLSSTLIAGAAGASAGVTYYGRLLTAAGDPVIASSVHFKIQIRTSGSENCLLYEEQQTKDLSASKGVFAITINDGTATVVNTEPFTLDRIFQNRGIFTFGAGKCVGGPSYAPNPTDGRKIAVEFNDGSFTGWEPMPAQAINFVPMAIESMTVGGFNAGGLVRVVDGAGTPALIPPLTQTQHNALLDLVNGTSAAYLPLSSPAAGFTGSLAGDVTGAQSATVVARIQGRAVDTAAPANGQALVWSAANSRWEPGTVSGGAADWSTLTGKPTTFASDWLTTANKPTSFPSDWLTLSNIPATFFPSAHSHSINEITSGAGIYLNYSPNGADCVAGEVLKWDTGGGGRWICGTDAGSAGTLVSLTTNSPIVKTGTASDPVLSISEASTSAKGVVQLASSSDTTAGLVVQANDSRLTDGRAPSGTASGELTGNYPNPTVVASTTASNNSLVRRDGSGGITGAAGSFSSIALTNGTSTLTLSTPVAFTTYATKLPASAGTNGQVLTSNGTDMIWSSASALTAGNVSGVVAVANGGTGATTGSIARTNLGFTATGNALATAADATAARSAISALSSTDSRLAPAPAAGNALNYIRVNSAGTAYEVRTVGSILSDIGAMTAVAPGTSGNVLTSNGTAWVSGAVPADTTKVSKSGDTMTGALNLPANGLVVGTDQLVVSGGKIGIGTGSPSSMLDVAGQSRSVNAAGVSQSNASASINWDNGNTQTMSVACTSTGFSNMLDGGTYVLAVTETSATTCTFAQSGLTFYFSPANGARTSGQRTVYTFQRIGNDVYVSWIKGFQ